MISGDFVAVKALGVIGETWTNKSIAFLSSQYICRYRDSRVQSPLKPFLAELFPPSALLGII